MDRSFLSDAEVIAATRDYVCIRLMSYENKEEMAFLKRIGAGKSGEAENTVFTILAPDGERLLTKASRSPRGTAAQLVENLARIAKDFTSRQDDRHRPELPLVANLRLAINVAACDRQPLVVIHAADGLERKKWLAAVSALAWSPEFIGRFVYVVVENRTELGPVEDASLESRLLVVDPDLYGQKGKVLQQIDGEPSARRLAQTLTTSLARFQRRTPNFWQHVKQGQSQGVFWETLTPVTDPMELRARQKGRKKTTPQD